MKVFETKHLIARHLEPEDVEDLYAIRGNPEIMRYVGDNQPISREQTRQWIEVAQRNYRRHGFGCMAVILKANNEFIGYCGLVYAPDNPAVEIIYAFKTQFWSQGLATEVAKEMLYFGFNQCRLRRIEASVDPENRASVRVVEKLGLKYDRQGVDENNLPTVWYSLERP